MSITVRSDSCGRQCTSLEQLDKLRDEAAEALHRCCGRARERCADAIHRSTSLISKWCDGRRRSPLERLVVLIDASLSSGKVEKRDSLEPIFFLNRRYGLDAHRCVTDPAPGLRRGSADLMREAGETASAVLEAIEDGEITEEERSRGDRELLELEAAVNALRARWESASVESAELRRFAS